MKGVEEKTGLRAEVTVESTSDGKGGAEKEWGGAARLGDSKIQYNNRRARGLGRMMSHAFFRGWRCDGDVALTVSALTVTVSEASL